jgi:hypothetical protein
MLAGAPTHAGKVDIGLKLFPDSAPTSLVTVSANQLELYTDVELKRLLCINPEAPKGECWLHYTELQLQDSDAL